MKLLKFLFDISLLFDKARDIRNEPTLRARSAYFGIESIVYSILTAAFFVVGVLLINLAIESGSIVLLILCGLFGVAFAISSLATLFHAVLRFALQLSINRRPITWIALAFIVLALAGAAIGAVLILT